MRTTEFRLIVQNFHEGDLDKVKAKGGAQNGYVSVLTTIDTSCAKLDFTFNEGDAPTAQQVLLNYCKLLGI